MVMIITTLQTPKACKVIFFYQINTAYHDPSGPNKELHNDVVRGGIL